MSTPSCEHDWALVLAEHTWSGPRRLSVCSRCHAMLREYLPNSASSDRPLSSTKEFGDYIRERVREDGERGPVSEHPDADRAPVLAVSTSDSRLRSVFPWSARVPRQRG